jgi:hypothetical protein
MSDQELANAAAIYFGGRARAEHWLSCSRCHSDDQGRPVLCTSHPDRSSHAHQSARLAFSC